VGGRFQRRSRWSSTIIYSAAISACEKGSQWQRALDLLQEMKDCDIRPVVIIYSAAMSACEKGGQWQRALDLLQEMKKCYVQPNVISYSAAISASDRGIFLSLRSPLVDTARNHRMDSFPAGRYCQKVLAVPCSAVACPSDASDCAEIRFAIF
jgi:pentatricopeptide repeat protein